MVQKDCKVLQSQAAYFHEVCAFIAWEQDVSAEGFPVSCLPIGASPLRTTTTASDDSEVAEASRGAFSILSRQDFPLKRKFSDAMGVPPLPDPTRYQQSIMKE